MAKTPKPTPEPSAPAGDPGTAGDPAITETLSQHPIFNLIPADPLQEAVRWALANPWIIPIALIVTYIAYREGWKYLTQQLEQRGKQLDPLKVIIRRGKQVLLKEDYWPVIQKPQKLAIKLQWLNWIRLTRTTLILTLVWLIAPPTNYLPLPQNTTDQLWLYGLALILALWVFLSLHAKKVNMYRNQIRTQMFNVAQSELRYEGGAELAITGYINITEWLDLYQPGEVHVAYPAKFRSEDERARAAFERNFTGTTSDQHAWTFKWESANNRVICTPVPYIPESASLPFPDTRSWDEIPLGITAGNEEVYLKVGTFPHTLLSGSTGSGKLQTLIERIPVPISERFPDGWATFGTIRVGDQVFDEKGNICRVTGVSEINETPDLYRVEFSDNSHVLASADHLWYTETRASRVSTSRVKTNTRKRDLLLSPETAANLKTRLATLTPESECTIPEVAKWAAALPTDSWLHDIARELGPVGEVTFQVEMNYEAQLMEQVQTMREFPEREEWQALAARTHELPGRMGRVDLLDYTTAKTSAPVKTYHAISFIEKVLAHEGQHRNDQREKRVVGGVRTTKEIMETLRTAEGHLNHSIPMHGPLQTPDIELPIDPMTLGHWSGGLTTLLRKEGLLQTSAEQGSQKRIPPIYLRASIQQRRDLLAGLMDTDGTVGDGSTVEFCNTNRDLAFGTLELARSLGYRATIREGRSTCNGKDYGPKWTVSWPCAPDDEVFTLTRKNKLHRERAKNYNAEKNSERYITSITPVPTQPGRCIMVDSPSRLFLTGDAMVPTHNSVTQRTILLHALQSPDWRVVMCDPKRVELTVYKDARNAITVASELEDMTDLLQQSEHEMYARYDRMMEEGVNFFKDMANPPPALMIMVDEVFALLSPENIKTDEGKQRDEMHARCTTLIGSIARLGRAAGIHLVLATQRPDAKVLPGEVRNNLDARIAQGRMDTTPSLMALDSDHATRLPKIKGRAILRQGEYSEFQAYFLPPEQLPQVIDMSNALASGVITPEDLIPSEGEVSAPAGDGKIDPARVLSEKWALVRGKLPHVPIPKVSLPGGLRERVTGWVEKRKRVVEENERAAGRLVAEREREIETRSDGGRERKQSEGSRELSRREVAEIAETTVAGEGGGFLAQVDLSSFDETAEQFGPLVGDVLRESALRGEPVAASELIAALRAEVEMFGGALPGSPEFPAGLDSLDEDFDLEEWEERERKGKKGKKSRKRAESGGHAEETEGDPRVESVGLAEARRIEEELMREFEDFEEMVGPESDEGLEPTLGVLPSERARVTPAWEAREDPPWDEEGEAFDRGVPGVSSGGLGAESGGFDFGDSAVEAGEPHGEPVEPVGASGVGAQPLRPRRSRNGARSVIERSGDSNDDNRASTPAGQPAGEGFPRAPAAMPSRPKRPARKPGGAPPPAPPVDMP